MAHASRMTRKLRNTRRERTVALRMVNMLEYQRDHARLTAIGLERELKKYIEKFGEIQPEGTINKMPRGVNSLADLLGEKPSAETQSDPANSSDRPNENRDGLEVPKS